MLADSQLAHPPGTLDGTPRPGLRRWVAPPANTNDNARWKEAWASVLFDGSVSLAAAIGGGRTRDGHAPPNAANSRRIEWFVADLLALVKTAAESLNSTEYELRIGIDHNNGLGQLTINTVDDFGFELDGLLPIRHFIPVDTTVRTDVSDDDGAR